MPFVLILIFLIVLASMGAVYVYMAKQDKLSTQNRVASQKSRAPYRPLRNQYNRAETFSSDYTVLDLETTGLNASESEIIEIGAIKYRDGAEVSRFHSYVKPTAPIPPESTAINHITNAMVSNAPAFDEVFRDFMRFIDKDVLIAHNAVFDIGFLQTRSQMQLSNEVIDTLSLARSWIKGLLNYKLETLKQFMGVSAISHTALGDCEVTGKVYAHCLSQMKAKHIPDKTEKDHALMNSTAAEYYNAFQAVLASAGKDTQNITALDTGNELIISLGSRIPLCIFHYSGRLKYWHIMMPIAVFANHYECTFKITPGAKSSGGEDVTRIFINNPSDLINFKQLILDIYEKSAKHIMRI